MPTEGLCIERVVQKFEGRNITRLDRTVKAVIILNAYSARHIDKQVESEQRIAVKILRAPGGCLGTER